MRFILSLLIALTFSFTALAQETAKPAEVTINPDNIKSLIKTLESETARTEFINNLKTLEQAQGEEKPAEAAAPIVISEQIGLETQTKTFFAKYHAFLAERNLNATLVGKWLITAGAVIIALILVISMSWGSGWIRRKMTRFAGRFSVSHTKRFRIYARIIKYYGYYLTFSLFLYALSVIWGFSDAKFFTHPMSAAIFYGIMNVVFVTLIAAFIGEVINGAIEYAINKAHNQNAQRLRTLLPLIRTILFTAFFVLFVLVVLSELGINVVPLLAGTGVLAVAIGFGAQTFINDFITGFTIILEDIFHVGDVVTIGGRTGVVETISLRKVQLRDYSGTVFTIPFSEIKVIENQTKDFSFYPIEMNVAYNGNVDAVIETMEEVSEDLRLNSDFKELILEPIEIAGVDRFGETALVIKARIKTKPSQQWPVGREFNRRLKRAFDARGIEIPVLMQTLVMNDKKGRGAAVEPDISDKDHRQPQE